jgi:hypothetical protein
MLSRVSKLIGVARSNFDLRLPTQYGWGVSLDLRFVKGLVGQKCSW